MRKSNLKVAMATLFASVILASCSILKDLEYTVNPNPIEMHGDEITVNIDGKFIEKGLNKNAFVTVTPTLVNAAGEELEFDYKSFKGEKAAGNGEVVKKDGHNFSYTSSRPYDPRFENAELIVKYVATKGGKEKLNDKTTKIADATIVTPLLLQNDDKVAMGEDKLIRSFKKTSKAVINYEKSKSVVKKVELSDADLSNLEGFLASANANSKINLDAIEIISYASPEGETDKNEDLAGDRATTAAAYLTAANEKLNLGINPAMIVKKPKGEDWDGLKELIKLTDQEDKNIIVAVAEMESDPVKREQEIKALSSTYKFLEEDIFPQLRRSQIVVTYTESGLTNDELTTMATTNPSSLTVEEMLFAGNKLISDMDTKLAIYKAVIAKDAKDWRGFTNAGAILYAKGMNTEANEMFTKAYVAEKNAITSNNMGMVKRQAGDINGAMEMFNNASGTGEIAAYNIGLINIKKGEYSSAITNMGPAATFNKALAQVLNKDYSSASTTLSNSDEADTAEGLYLKAIIAARTGKDSEVISSLTSAIAKDSSLKAKAKKDREFVKYFENTAFMAL
jgi:tetratricopeptide (TPR) repeat protein